MSKFVIDKSFNFSYGHRVHVQKLRTDFCAKGDTGTKCRFPHGHEGLVKVFVEADDLNPQSMVVDFKELGFVKDFLDDAIDHKFIIDRNDPVFSQIINGELHDTDDGEALSIDENNFLLLPLVPVSIPGTDLIAGYHLDVSRHVSGATKELYEGYFIVDFCPTSENLSRWLFNVVQSKLKKIGVKVNCIEWNETPKSRAVYTGNEAE